MPIQIANLVAKVAFESKKAVADMQNFTRFTRRAGTKIQGFSQNSKIQLFAIGKTWNLLGSAAKGALSKMIASTPLLQAEMAMLNFQFYELFRTLGESLAPVFEKIVDWVTKGVGWFKSLSPEVQEATAQIIGLAGAFVGLRPLLAALPGLFSPVTLAIGAIILALGFLKTAYQENIGGFRDTVDEFVVFFKNAWDSLKVPIEALWEVIQDIFANQIVPFLESILPEIQWFLETIGEGLTLIAAIAEGDLVTAFTTAGNIVKSTLEKIASSIWDTLTNVGKWFNDFMQKVLHPESPFDGGEPIPDYFGDIGDLFGDLFDTPPDPLHIDPPPGGGGGGAGTSPLGYSSTVVYNDIDITVDASGSTADAYDIAVKTSETLADELSNIQNW